MGLPSNAKVKALFGVKAADQAAGDYAGGEGCACRAFALEQHSGGRYAIEVTSSK